MNLWIPVFLVWVAIEYAYTRLTVHIIEGNALLAGTFSAVVVALLAITTVGYTQDPWLIIPATAGAGVGTYITVRYTP